MALWKLERTDNRERRAHEIYNLMCKYCCSEKLTENDPFLVFGLSTEWFGCWRTAQDNSTEQIGTTGHDIVGGPLPPLAVGTRRNSLGCVISGNVSNGGISSRQIIGQIPTFWNSINRIDGQSATPGSHKGQSLDTGGTTNLAADPFNGNQKHGNQSTEHGENRRRTSRRNEGVVKGIGFVQGTGDLSIDDCIALVPDSDRVSAIQKRKEIARIEVEKL